ncbi:MAG: hypothetical protein IPL53_25380 [Ignavibacteria bacterium]|nr:hypothetical protein [Ignavibacteria bacterium]
MKNKFTIFFLLILPVLFFITSYLLKEYQGPYYTNSQYDPGYVYLISSLNLSQMSGYGVGHIDHPGTPVQVIGAVVIKLGYLFSGSDDNMVKDVLMNPEKYMSEINYVFLFINCIGLFILGLAAYKAYSNVSVSLLMQLTPFTSISILSLSTLVRPENFMIFIVCIFISALILFVNEIEMNPKKNMRYLMLLGIISGLGLASKITFFPLILIPLMLFRGIKYKLIYLLIIAISFIIFVIPAVSAYNINYFIEWVFNLFLYSKKYGRGEPTIIDSNSFLYNIRRIISKEFIFDIAYFMICLSLFVCLIPRAGNYFAKFKNEFLKNTGNRLKRIKIGFTDDTKFRLVLGLFLTMTLQVLIVAKHYGENYMFPALILSVYAMITSFTVMSDALPSKLNHAKMKIVYTLVLILITLFALRSFYTYGSYLKNLTAETNKVLNYLKENSGDAVLISSHHVPSPEFALFTGTGYAVSQRENYNSILNEKYPAGYFNLNNSCYTFGSDSVNAVNDFKTAGKVLYLSSGEDYVEQFKKVLNTKYGISNAVFEKKFSNSKGEMVYEIKFGNFE